MAAHDGMALYSKEDNPLTHSSIKVSLSGHTKKYPSADTQKTCPNICFSSLDTCVNMLLQPLLILFLDNINVKSSQVFNAVAWKTS